MSKNLLVILIIECTIHFTIKVIRLRCVATASYSLEKMEVEVI